MSEERFKNYEANMAHNIARRLPLVGASQEEEPFYRDVMKWCVMNYDLMECFSKIITDEEYFEFLERCYERKDVEAYGLAIATRLQWLQME